MSNVCICYFRFEFRLLHLFIQKVFIDKFWHFCCYYLELDVYNIINEIDCLMFSLDGNFVLLAESSFDVPLW